LTPEAAEFKRLVEPLVDWVRRNPKLIVQAQAYNRHHGGGDDVEALLGIGGVGADTSELDDDEDTVDDEPGGARGRGLV
jgi:hypothetical protein